MSLAGRRDDEWSRSEDFKREAVLSKLLQVIRSDNEQVASRAIECFATGTNAATRLAPFTNALIRVANENASSKCKLAAIGSLSGLASNSVSNSLARLLEDRDEDIRVGSVRLLPRFSAPFAEEALRSAADDESPKVRSVVADVIGEEKYVHLVPTLARLFNDPVGRDPLISPMTIEYLRAGQRWNNIGDVYTSAGLALVKFDLDHVGDILKEHLDDPGFHINFVSKLAEEDAEPWLDELVRILEERIAFVEEVAELPRHDSRRMDVHASDKILFGTYAKCWMDILQHLMRLPHKELSGSKQNDLMDLLDKTVHPVPGCQSCGVEPARRLYEFYRLNGISERADEIRRHFAKSDGWWFDDFDGNLPDQ